MYIERNGYVVMKSSEMNFYGNDSLYEENIEDAVIFDDYSEAKELAQNLTQEKNGNWEVIRYNRTIWLDRYIEKDDDGYQCCCENNSECCCNNESEILEEGEKE